MQAGVAGDGCEWHDALLLLLSRPTLGLTSSCRFIVDGAITLPIALYGFLIFPDVPATTKAFYLSEEVQCSSHSSERDLHSTIVSSL